MTRAGRAGRRIIIRVDWAGRSYDLATGSIQRDAAIVTAEAALTDPGDFAQGAELVEEPSG